MFYAKCAQPEAVVSVQGLAFSFAGSIPTFPVSTNIVSPLISHAQTVSGGSTRQGLNSLLISRAMMTLRYMITPCMPMKAFIFCSFF